MPRRDSTAPIAVAPGRPPASFALARPKLVPRARLAPVRQQARAMTSLVLGHALDRHGATTRAAAVLCVSESIVRRWCDPDEPQQAAVSDVVALYVAGLHAVAWGMVDDVVALLDALGTAREWEPREHALSLSTAAGIAAQAARDGDLTRYRSALHDLLQGAREALRDTNDQGEISR